MSGGTSAVAGYNYQFQKTALVLLRADQGERVCIEGILEDIDIEGISGVHAIQCKYHAEVKAFNLSLIYEPVLRMMVHRVEHHDSRTQYRLFVHVPGKAPEKRRLTSLELEKALKSNNRQLVKLIERANGKICLEEFSSHMILEFGPSYEELQAELLRELGDLNLDSDARTVLYPNAVQYVAEKSWVQFPICTPKTKQYRSLREES